MDEHQAQELKLKVHIDQTEIDEMMQKFERIRDLMNEANSLTRELASEEKVVKIRFES